MLQAYDEGRLDKLYIVTNRFVNTMSQVPTIVQVLPLPPSDDENLKKKTWDYLYEPDPKALLDSLYGATSKRWYTEALWKTWPVSRPPVWLQ